MINLRSPFNKFLLVSPDDAADLPRFDSNRVIALYVGTGGDVSVTADDNIATVVFAAVPSGTFLPLTVRRVNAAATTATNILALYSV